MTKMASARRIVPRRWAMTTDVRPHISLSRASMTACWETESRPAVGSSRIRIGVLRMMARAIAMRRSKKPTWDGVVAVAAVAAVGKGPLPWRLDGSQMADDSCESSEEDLAPLSRILSALEVRQ
jgi:hypothetical protein